MVGLRVRLLGEFGETLGERLIFVRHRHIHRRGLHLRRMEFEEGEFRRDTVGRFALEQVQFILRVETIGNEEGLQLLIFLQAIGEDRRSEVAERVFPKKHLERLIFVGDAFDTTSQSAKSVIFLSSHNADY